MQIQTLQVPIRELAEGFLERPEGDQVTGMNGRLIIRPEYQRAFLYEPKRQQLVIDSVLHEYPLGPMYFAPAEQDETRMEVLDGQQRIISICRYVSGGFSVPWGQGVNAKEYFFENLPEADRQRLLNYVLNVFMCTGADEEKMAWFQRINVAGLILTDQEMRNANWHGPWVSDARRLFSSVNSPANRHFGKYLKGSALRQELLQDAILWWARSQHITGADDGMMIDRCMSLHRWDKDAAPLFRYIETVFKWVEKVYPNYHPQMKGVDWGALYERFHHVDLDPIALDIRVNDLLADPEVQRKSAIWQYLLDDDATKLNLRAFDKATKEQVYDLQTAQARTVGESNCPMCVLEAGADRDRIWELNQMEADHITPWSKGGKTEPVNCQMLCKRHNRMKAAL